MAGRPLKANHVSIPLIVSDGKRVISEQKIASNLFDKNLIDVAAKSLGPTVETRHYDGLGDALVGIGDLKQNARDGFQFYTAIIDTENGKIIKMGLPCIITDSGEKIFLSATDLKPEDLAVFARNLPSKYKLAVVVRFDRGMMQDFTLNESSGFASLDMGNQSMVPQDVLASTKLFPEPSQEKDNRLNSNLNEKKCVGCSGDSNAKVDTSKKLVLRMYTGDDELPVTLDGVSDLTPVKTWQRQADLLSVHPSYIIDQSMALPAASFGYSNALFPETKQKANDVFPEQIREFVLSYVLFAVKSRANEFVLGPSPAGNDGIKFLSTSSDGATTIKKGVLSIVETDCCPNSPSGQIDRSQRMLEFFNPFMDENLSHHNRSFSKRTLIPSQKTTQPMAESLQLVDAFSKEKKKVPQPGVAMACQVRPAFHDKETSAWPKPRIQRISDNKKKPLGLRFEKFYRETSPNKRAGAKAVRGPRTRQAADALVLNLKKRLSGHQGQGRNLSGTGVPGKKNSLMQNNRERKTRQDSHNPLGKNHSSIKKKSGVPCHVLPKTRKDGSRDIFRIRSISVPSESSLHPNAFRTANTKKAEKAKDVAKLPASRIKSALKQETVIRNPKRPKRDASHKLADLFDRPKRRRKKRRFSI